MMDRRAGGIGRGWAGFTVIELMVVCGIIVILATLTVLGLSKVNDRMKATSTRQTLAGLASLLKEAEQQGVLKRQPGGVFENDGTYRNIKDNTGVDLPDPTTKLVPDLWRRPDVTSTTVTTVVAPSGVVSTSGGPVKNTGIALTLLGGNPSVAKSLANYPAGVARLASPWNAGARYSPGARVLYSEDPTDPSKPLLVYVAIANAAGVAQKPTSASYWQPDYSAFQDSWNNPILFVPACGMSGISAGGQNYTAKASDGKPFWASAGPDGDFSKGDDNLYSFEN